MKGVVVFIALCVTFSGASTKIAPERQWQRIVGGDPTTIYEYPYGVAMLLRLEENVFRQWCGGSILTSTAILSAAHCYDRFGTPHSPSEWNIRVGSTYHASGGTVYPIRQIILHPNYDFVLLDNDVAVLRTTTNIVYGPGVQPASIAGINYNLADNEPVWAIGWGMTMSAQSNAMLRHVQVYTINQEICRARYGADLVTDTMLCSGLLDIGGKDQCSGDSGGPLLHHGVVVGVCSWGFGCASPFYPGVNARVTVLSNWIVAAAQS